MNDDVEAALAIGADGLHIGQEDTGARAARKMIGRDMILGLSVETEELAAAVEPGLVDYVGIGPGFATPTKPDHKQPIGVDGLARLVAVTTVPAVAIGGLKTEHAAAVLARGRQGARWSFPRSAACPIRKPPRCASRKPSQGSA